MYFQFFFRSPIAPFNEKKIDNHENFLFVKFKLEIRVLEKISSNLNSFQNNIYFFMKEIFEKLLFFIIFILSY